MSARATGAPDRWNPEKYLGYADERTRPAVDLLARIPLEQPARIVDLGCGAGNVTSLLRARWSDAEITGIDGSPEMLARAKKANSGADIAWIQADIADWRDTELDLIYSNAALHWLDDHPVLLPRLVQCLGEGGVLAIQMPCNHRAPSHQSIVETIDAGSWRDRLKPHYRESPVGTPKDYLDWLAEVVDICEVWTTTYYHMLTGEDPVVAWTSETALKPLLDVLENEEREAFVADYATRVSAAYPRRSDGQTVFPFERLFIVARRCL